MISNSAVLLLTKKESFKFKKCNLFCALYLTAWNLFPLFSVHTNHGFFRLLYGAIVAIWIITALINLKRETALIFVFLMFLFLLVPLIYLMIGRGDMRPSNLVNYLLLFGFGLNSSLYSELNDDRLDKLIVWASFLVISITCVTTIIGLFKYPDASRLLTSSSTDETTAFFLREKNIGAYDFIYGITICLIPFIFFWKTSKKMAKLVLLPFLVLLIICVLISRFATAYLLLFISFLLLIIFYKKRRRIWPIVLIALVLLILAPFLLRFFLQALYNNTNSLLLKEKMQGILNVLDGKENIGETTSRFSLVIRSCKSFITNPFFGVGGYYSTSANNGVGQHCQFIDDFARFGILGGLPLLLFVVFSFAKINYGFRGHIINRKVVVPIILFVFLGFLNPIYVYGILTCFYLISPACCRINNRLEQNL